MGWMDARARACACVRAYVRVRACVCVWGVVGWWARGGGDVKFYCVVMYCNILRCFIRQEIKICMIRKGNFALNLLCV